MSIENKKNKIVKGIKVFFKKYKTKKAVIGLSGGVDSSLAAYLVKEALGRKNLTGLIMPYYGISSESNINDAKIISKKLGIKSYLLPINKIFNTHKIPWKKTKIADANLKARIRATLLYSYANSNNAIVVGTGNKTELYLGYFTKYGDGAVDVLPLGNLWKKEVRQMAEYIGISNSIIWKVPSAELWKGQTDEAELGISYDVADEILISLIDKKQPEKPLRNQNSKESQTKKIKKMMKESIHKRNPPQIINC